MSEVIRDLVGNYGVVNSEETVKYSLNLEENNGSSRENNAHDDTSDALDSIKCIFPHYGEGFLQACLKVSIAKIFLCLLVFVDDNYYIS